MFSSWSDGGAAKHTIVTPAAATTYTATFARGTAVGAAADTYARNGAYASQNFGTQTRVNAKQSNSVETSGRYSSASRLNADGETPPCFASMARRAPRRRTANVHAVANTPWSETRAHVE